jgi:hypothetical protein
VAGRYEIAHLKPIPPAPFPLKREGECFQKHLFVLPGVISGKTRFILPPFAKGGRMRVGFGGGITGNKIWFEIRLISLVTQLT